MDADEYKELHEAIEEGDLELVRNLLQDHTEEQHFKYENTSGLYKAFKLKKYEIASLLIHIGAKLVDSEDDYLFGLDIDLTRVNYLLSDYNRKSEKSCIFRLLSLSQSPQGLDRERLYAVKSMYEKFFHSEILKLLLMVLENEIFDIVYDFTSEKINRVHRLSTEEYEVYGLTRSDTKEIFVGAKNLLSSISKEKEKVYGVVAEELCHLALTTLFENNADPYREKNSKLKQEFCNIVEAVKSSINPSSETESVIKDVFVNYESTDWECELIARVPHVIGLYGQKHGRKIFLKSPELSRVLSFYEKNVIPSCKLYTDPALNTKPHRMIQELMKKNELLSFQDKQIRPLKNGFPSFREYLEGEKGIFAISTNCARLCVLHVFHELKGEFEELMEKKCLFFNGMYFKEKKDKILVALKVILWEYLIFVLDDKMNFQSFQDQYFYYFEEFISKGLNIIIISDSQILDEALKIEKVLNYSWNDLSEEFQIRMESVRFIFNGKEKATFVDKDDFLNIFTEEEIFRIINGEIIEICDGEELLSQGYVPETYIERRFQVMTVDRKFLENLHSNISIFLSGLHKNENRDFLRNERLVQWLDGSDEEIQVDKSVFISLKSGRGSMNFEEFVRKSKTKYNIWLHYDNHLKLFILRNRDTCDNELKLFLKERTLTEEEMLYSLRTKQTVIISENAGCGKSTITSSLISGLKSCIHYQPWIWRINFNQFSTDENDLLSLANINENCDDEEIFDHLFCMLKLDHGLEKLLFKRVSQICFLFFDGFDEIPLKYQNNAFKLLATIREKTTTNIITTTRRHHQLELEQLLSTYSHQLVPFSREDQVRFLEMFWKCKLKYPYGKGKQTSKKDQRGVPEKIKKIIKESNKQETILDMDYQDLICGLEKIDVRKSLDLIRTEMDKLNLTKLSENILQKTLLNQETLEFMGIPLHLYMIGTIHFVGNFKLEIKPDIYSLYSVFIDQKILIYLEEKQGLWHAGRVKDNEVERTRKDTYRVHAELASHLLDEGNIYKHSNMTEDDLELCTALGIVFMHSGEVHFLHQTFAEFFKAESLRIKLEKQVLIEMLFERKHNAVIRFLSSALEKKNFENLKNEFFQDTDFLVKIMKLIIEIDPVSRPTNVSNAENSCLFKIVKKLLEKFREDDIKKDLVNKFIEGLHELIVSILEKCSNNYMHPMKLGVCLTVQFIKDLISKNFTIYSIMILKFVRSSENLQEVMDILEECISYNIIGDCDRGSHQVESEGDENMNIESKEGFLELLRIEDSDGKGLLYHGLWNGRAEVFPFLLKFARCVLGKDLFIKVIVESYEHKLHLKNFIEHVNQSKISTLFKELKNIFGADIEILINNGLIFLVICRAVEFDKGDKSSKSLKSMISLLQDCCGVIKLKEFLLGKDDEGENLTHKLICHSSIEEFLKFLNIIKNVINDREDMKQLLGSKNRYLRNIFHLAALKSDSYLNELLKFCYEHCEKSGIKKMLVSVDNIGNNVIHLLLLQNSPETLRKNLTAINEILAEGEWFRQFLKSKGESSKNIFHLASIEDMDLDDLILLLNTYLEKDEIKEMLFCANEHGYNVIHLLVLSNSTEKLCRNLKVIENCLGDVEWYKRLLQSKGQNSMNFLHLAAHYDKNLQDLLQLCDNHFKKVEIKEMLFSATELGDNVMNILFFKNSHKTLEKNLNHIKETLGNDVWFKQLLSSVGQNSFGNLHLAAHRNMCLGYLLQIFLGHFQKTEIKEMLFSTNADGDNLVHLLVWNNSSQMLLNNLKLIERMLGNREWFKELLISKGQDSMNLLHVAAGRGIYLYDLIQLYVAHFQKDELKEILFNTNVNDVNVIHFLVLKNSPQMLVKNLKLIKKIICDDECFQLLLKSKIQNSLTMLHLATARDWYLDDLLQFLCNELEKESLEELLLSRDASGDDVIDNLISNNSTKTMMKNLTFMNEMRGDDKWLKEVFKRKGKSFQSILQLASLEDFYHYDLLHFYNAFLEKNEFKEMLLINDTDGNKFIHLLVSNNSLETLMRNLKLIMEIVDEKEWFKQLLVSKGKNNMSILHLAAYRDIYLYDLLQFYDAHFKRDEMKNIFLNTDADGYNFIHLLVSKNSADILLQNLNCIKEIVGDNECLKEIFQSKSQNYWNLLHIAANRDMYLHKLLQFLSDHSQEDTIREMLCSTDGDGDTVIHLLVAQSSSELLWKNLKLIEKSLGDERFKLLLKSRGKFLKNIFHLAALDSLYFEDILQYADNLCIKDEIRNMLLSSDSGGYNVIYHLFSKNASEKLLETFNLIKKILDSDDMFLQLFRSNDISLKNIFHSLIIEDVSLDEVLQVSLFYLKNDDIKEMLLNIDENGNSIIHLLVMRTCPKTLEKTLQLMEKIIGDDVLFHQLLHYKGQKSQNILHFAAGRDMNLEFLLNFLDARIEKVAIKEMLLSTNEECDNVTHLLALNNSYNTLLSNLMVLKVIVNDDKFYKLLLKSQRNNSMNFFHLTVVRDINLDGLLQFANDLFDKDEIREMFLTPTENGYNIIDLLALKNSSYITMMNLKIVKEFLGDDEWHRLCLESEGDTLKQLFQLVSIEDAHYIDLLNYCYDKLDRDEIMEMLLNTSKFSNDEIQISVKNYSLGVFVRNLKLVKEILGEEDLFKIFLESKGKILEKMFQLTSIEPIYLDDLLQFCVTSFEKDRIKDFLSSTDECGNNVIHSLVLNNSSAIFMRNLEFIRETLADDNWFKHLLMSKGKSLQNIFHLVSFKDIYVDDLLNFCDLLLKTDEMKEMLLSTNEEGQNVIYLLVLNNSPEMLMKNLNFIKDIIGEVDWLKLNLKSIDQVSLNLLHLAAYRDIHLDCIIQFCESLFQKDEINEMLFSPAKNGNNVINVLIIENSPDRLLKNLHLLERILGDGERFKQLLMSKSQHSLNNLYFAACRNMHLEELLQFFSNYFDKNEIKEMLLSSDTYGNNIIHALVLKNSSEMFINNLEVIRLILGDEEFKYILKFKGQSPKNVFHLASYEDVDLHDLLLFYEAHLHKDEIAGMLLCSTDNENYIIHLLVLNNSPQTLIKNLKLIKEILGSKEKFKQFLKCKGANAMNMLHLATDKDIYLYDILHFLCKYLSKEEIKEMLLVTDIKGDNVIHQLFWRNSTEMLRKNLKLIEKMVKCNEFFKQLLLSKGGNSMSLLLIAAERGMDFDDILHLFVIYLKKDEIKEMFLSTDEDGDNVIHLLVIEKIFDKLSKNLKLMKDTVDDDEWFKQLLKSTGQKSMNILHLASSVGTPLHNVLKILKDHLQKDEIKHLLFSLNEFGDNVIHVLIGKNSPALLNENLKLIKEILGDNDWFKELLKSRGQCSKNIFHLVSLENVCLGDLVFLFNKYFKMDEIKEMLLSKDANGYNVIHFLFLKNSSEMLMNNLKIIKENIADDHWFKQFLRSRGYYFRNIFHLAAVNSNEISLNFLHLYLLENEIVDLLTESDDNGQTCLHCAAYCFKNILLLLDYALEMFKFDAGRFKGLILAEDNDGGTFLHCLGKWTEDDSTIHLVNEILLSLRKKLSDDLYHKIMRKRNKERQTFLQIDRKHKLDFIERCRQVLEIDLFEELK